MSREMSDAMKSSMTRTVSWTNSLAAEIYGVIEYINRFLRYISLNLERKKKENHVNHKVEISIFYHNFLDLSVLLNIETSFFK